MFKLSLRLFKIACCLLLSISTLSNAQSIEPLGNLQTLEGWTGLKQTDNGAIWDLSQQAAFMYPGNADSKGFKATLGFFERFDPSADWWDWPILSMEVKLPDAGDTLDMSVRLHWPQASGGTRDKMEDIKPVKLRITGKGWQTLSIPVDSFRASESIKPIHLNFVTGISMQGKLASGQTQLNLRNVQLQRGQTVAMMADITSKPASKDQTVTYDLTLYNCTHTTQAINLRLKRVGWEVLTPNLSVEQVTLKAGQSTNVTFSAKMVDRMPAGARETWTVVATPNGREDQAASIQLTTIARMPSPSIWHTADGWQNVRDKVASHAWAKYLADEQIKRADKWRVPELDVNRRNKETGQRYVFYTPQEHNLVASAISWQLTRDAKYAQKVRTFLMRLSDPTQGYPSTLQGCSQAWVQEGHFFQNIARSYDAIRDSGLLSDQDQQQIEASLRIYMDFVSRYPAGIGNWDISALTGAVYCALAVQDWDKLDEYLNGPCCLVWQLRRGVMDDGWWYECSPGYNLWCAQEYTEIGLALKPWGENFLDKTYPAVFSYDVRMGAKVGNDEVGEGEHGINFNLWGPNTRPGRQIKDMWNSLTELLNEDGKMFGINDANPELGETTSRYDLAYAAYGDKRYADIVQRGDVKKRNLLYGVPELPVTPKGQKLPTTKSDNAGVAILRSQAQTQTPHEQYQVALKYGTHGGYHGHYDRLNMVYLRRFGKIATSTRTSWWSYFPYMYRFFVQNSITHSMVIVDGKMQMPAQSKVLAYKKGEKFQAMAVENVSQWANPPYGGLCYSWWKGDFKAKQWNEGRYLPDVEVDPGYGKVNDYSEPIRSRRAMVVTDDFVLLADSVQADKEHRFDALLQFQGFTQVTGKNVTFKEQRPQFDTNPLGNGQLVLDNDVYTATGTTLAKFVQHYEPGNPIPVKAPSDKATEQLHIDAYTVWPTQQREVIVGHMATPQSVAKHLWYQVVADGQTLVDDKTGAWLLGARDINVDITGKKILTLKTKIDPKKRYRNKSIFWGDPAIITAEGKTLYLADLKIQSDNIVATPVTGEDYYGGEVHIAGKPFAKSVPANPSDQKQDATISIDLTGLNAVKFVGRIGSDYPLGDSSQLGRIYSHRTTGKNARYLTVLEVHQGKPVIKTAKAIDANTVQVQLLDGRTQQVKVSGLDSAEGQLAFEVTDIK
ncbi:MAG TPA: hypothetical protein DER01_03235 [Phycisphaerales bacterium]|nr:hypothetical protein [Phycisphaerales bacterium]|tara:strand:- start:63389 stop:66916 length:3528 start_codon:yes stop_codon:yes gene_type:complete